MNTMFGCLINRKICADEKVVPQVEEDRKAIYRDELTKTRSPPLASKAVKKSVRFADSEETILGEGEGRRIRVKVKMTKEEAARLLSKCKEGGLLEFKDVARQLVELPVNRVSVLSI